MLNVTDTMEAATEHHEAGRFLQAERLYQMVLQSNPDHPAILQSPGAIAHQQDRLAVSSPGKPGAK